jgi:hypothetical protein
MKTVKYWRWRYRDPQLGCIRHTTASMTEEEAAAYPEAERIDGSLTVREVDDALGENLEVCSGDPNLADMISRSAHQRTADCAGTPTWREITLIRRYDLT